MHNLAVFSLVVAVAQLLSSPAASLSETASVGFSFDDFRINTFQGPLPPPDNQPPVQQVVGSFSFEVPDSFELQQSFLIEPIDFDINIELEAEAEFFGRFIGGANPSFQLDYVPEGNVLGAVGSQYRDFFLSVPLNGPSSSIRPLFIYTNANFGSSAFLSNSGETTYTTAPSGSHSVVPLPAAFWMLLGGIAALVGMKRFRGANRVCIRQT